MSSTLHITPIGHRGEVIFVLPIKGVFGEVLCDTDGTIGYTTEFDPKTALQIVNQCKKIVNTHPGDAAKLDKVRRWALAGYQLLARWQH